MRRTAPVLLSLAVLLACGSLLAQPEDDLAATERARLKALVEADMATAERLHADDFQLINPLGGALTKAEYLGGIASEQIDYLKWEPGAIQVRRYGDAAVLRYQAELEIVVAGQRTPLTRYWHTDLYERRGDRWQVVWSHATEVR
jgi:ketosteroid isomerase-like protein